MDSLHPSPRGKKVLAGASKTAGGPTREKFSPRALREAHRADRDAGRRKQPIREA